MWEQVVIESKANQKRGPVISIKFFFPLLVPIRFPDAADCLNDTHDGGGEVKKKNPTIVTNLSEWKMAEVHSLRLGKETL